MSLLAIFASLIVFQMDPNARGSTVETVKRIERKICQKKCFKVLASSKLCLTKTVIGKHLFRVILLFGLFYRGDNQHRRRDKCLVPIKDALLTKQKNRFVIEIECPYLA